MIVGSISEDRSKEKRVAITPEIIKQYKSLGIEVYLCKDYALHLGITDSAYEQEGVKIFQTDEDVISNSNANKIMVVSLDKLELVGSINVGEIPDGVAVSL